MAETPSAYLVVRTADGYGAVFPLTAAQGCTLGRAPSNRVVLKDYLLLPTDRGMALQHRMDATLSYDSARSPDQWKLAVRWQDRDIHVGFANDHRRHRPQRHCESNPGPESTGWRLSADRLVCWRLRLGTRSS